MLSATAGCSQWVGCLLPGCAVDELATPPRSAVVVRSLSPPPVVVRPVVAKLRSARQVLASETETAVCIGGDPNSLMLLAHPLVKAGMKVTVVDVVPDWITALRRNGSCFRLTLLGEDGDTTETIPVLLDETSTFHSDTTAERMCRCDLIATCLDRTELEAFVPRLLTLLRRRKALSQNRALRVLQVERVSVCSDIQFVDVKQIVQTAAAAWPAEAQMWLKERVTFHKAVAVDVIPDNIRYYTQGRLTAISEPSLVFSGDDSLLPEMERTDDLPSLRARCLLCQSLAFVVGVLKDYRAQQLPTTNQLTQAMLEAFDGLASDEIWPSKRATAIELARTITNSRWTVRPDKVQTDKCLRPAISAFQMTLRQNSSNDALQHLLRLGLIAVERQIGVSVRDLLIQLTENDDSFDQVECLLLLEKE